MSNKIGHTGSEMAKATVLAYNSIRKEDAEFTYCRLEHDVMGELYHIVFNACMLCYECYVDANTSEVLGQISEPEEITEYPVCVCA